MLVNVGNDDSDWMNRRQQTTTMMELQTTQGTVTVMERIKSNESTQHQQQQQLTRPGGLSYCNDHEGNIVMGSCRHNRNRFVLHGWYFMLILLLSGLPLLASGYSIGAKIQKSAGCYHNGTIYAERSLIPTVEPCLTCRCANKSLVCALKICPEQAFPPPRGCVLVQPKRACCPYLSCKTFRRNPIESELLSRMNSFAISNGKYDVDKEHLTDVDNGVSDSDNNLQRSDDIDLHEENNVCIEDGSVYGSGSAMVSSNFCSYCYCFAGKRVCVKPKCLLPNHKCRPIYASGSCCPVHYDCEHNKNSNSTEQALTDNVHGDGDGGEESNNDTQSDDNDTLASENSVTQEIDLPAVSQNRNYLRKTKLPDTKVRCYDNTTSASYFDGQKLPTNKDKPCEMCFCIRGSVMCTPKKCAPYIGNCIPIIPDGECCAIGYECRNKSNEVTRHFRQDDNEDFDLFSLLFGSNKATNEPEEDDDDEEENEEETDNTNADDDNENDDDETQDEEGSGSSGTNSTNTNNEDDDEDDDNETDDDDTDAENLGTVVTKVKNERPIRTTTERQKGFFDLLREGLAALESSAEEINSTLFEDDDDGNFTEFLRTSTQYKIEHPVTVKTDFHNRNESSSHNSTTTAPDFRPLSYFISTSTFRTANKNHSEPLTTTSDRTTTTSDDEDQASTKKVPHLIKRHNETSEEFVFVPLQPNYGVSRPKIPLSTTLMQVTEPTTVEKSTIHLTHAEQKFTGRPNSKMTTNKVKPSGTVKPVTPVTPKVRPRPPTQYIPARTTTKPSVKITTKPSVLKYSEQNQTRHTQHLSTRSPSAETHTPTPADDSTEIIGTEIRMDTVTRVAEHDKTVQKHEEKHTFGDTHKHNKPPNTHVVHKHTEIETVEAEKHKAPTQVVHKQAKPLNTHVVHKHTEIETVEAEKHKAPTHEVEKHKAPTHVIHKHTEIYESDAVKHDSVKHEAPVHKKHSEESVHHEKKPHDEHKNTHKHTHKETVETVEIVQSTLVHPTVETKTTTHESTSEEILEPSTPPPFKPLKVGNVSANTFLSAFLNMFEKPSAPLKSQPIVTATPATTPKPLEIKSNPTILESDFNSDYDQASLPPSLPNLRIIPFVPDDAVALTKEDLKKYPSITENPNVVVDRMDEEGKYEPQDDDDDRKTGEYYVTYTAQAAPSPNGALTNVISGERFSPPLRTEGGFVPRPIKIENVYITTSHPESPPEIVEKHLESVSSWNEDLTSISSTSRKPHLDLSKPPHKPTLTIEELFPWSDSSEKKIPPFKSISKETLHHLKQPETIESSVYVKVPEIVKVSSIKEANTVEEILAHLSLSKTQTGESHAQTFGDHSFKIKPSEDGALSYQVVGIGDTKITDENLYAATIHHHKPTSNDHAELVSGHRPDHETATIKTTYRLTSEGIKVDGPNRHVVTTTHHGPLAHKIHTSNQWPELVKSHHNVWPETTTIRHSGEHHSSSATRPWSDSHTLTTNSHRPSWHESHHISKNPWETQSSNHHFSSSSSSSSPQPWSSDHITTTSSRPWPEAVVKHSSESHHTPWPETTIKHDRTSLKPWSDHSISSTSSKPWFESQHISTSSSQPWSSSSESKHKDSWYDSVVKFDTTHTERKPWSDIIKHDNSDEELYKLWASSAESKPSLTHHIPLSHKPWSDSGSKPWSSSSSKPWPSSSSKSWSSTTFKPWSETTIKQSWPNSELNHHISSEHKPSWEDSEIKSWSETFPSHDKPWNSHHSPSTHHKIHHSAISDYSSYPEIKEVTLETKLTSSEDHGLPLNLQTVPEVIKISHNRRVSENLDSEVKNDLHIGEILVGSAAEDLYNPQIFEKPKKSSPLDSLLRLSGCNIYGEMYKVGELIGELSDSCSQCFCTDSGVQCRSCTER